MNGYRYIFDTNAIVALLKGNTNLTSLSGTALWIGISIISSIEFLAFPDLSEDDKSLFNLFLQRVDIIGIDKSSPQLLEEIIRFRKKYKIKLPDSIIVATAFVNNARLVTADKQLLKISEIEIINY